MSKGKPREGVVIEGRKRKRPPRAKAGPTTAITLERQMQVLTLSRAGHKCPAIGNLLGISRFQAYAALKAGLDAVREEIAEQADELRARELDRLDALLIACWAKATATNPDWQAMEKALKILERRAKLLGLDAPIKVTTPKDQPFEIAATQATATQPAQAVDYATMSEADLTAHFVQAVRGLEPAALAPPQQDNNAGSPAPKPVAGA